MKETFVFQSLDESDLDPWWDDQRGVRLSDGPRHRSIVVTHGNKEGRTASLVGQGTRVRRHDKVVCCYPKQVGEKHPNWDMVFPEWEGLVWVRRGLNYYDDLVVVVATSEAELND